MMIFVYPTETCYGIGCSVFNKEEIKKIYELKKRPENKPLIVLVNSILMWKSISSVSERALGLARKYWPGPITIIQPKKKCIPNILTKKDLGVRWSPHSVPNKIISGLGEPIVSTSANISGEDNPYSIDDIPESILENVDRIFDEGELEYNPPSTVVSVSDDEIKILRKGSISP